MTRAYSTFGHYGGAQYVPRQWLAAFFTSSAIYVGLAVATTVFGLGTHQMAAEKPVDVTFVEKVIKDEPPPAPPTPVPVKPEAPAPVVPKDMKVRKLDKPPPAKELIAPKEMPQEAPAEADPSLDKGIAMWGDGEVDPAALEGGYRVGSAAGMKGAMALPEGGVPPKPSKRNVQPEYPVAARRAGKTGRVVLKIVVTAEGKVTDIQVVEGEEPFVTSAVNAVKRWKYEPARYDGKPITVYRIIHVGFKLEA